MRKDRSDVSEGAKGGRARRTRRPGGMSSEERVSHSRVLINNLKDELDKKGSYGELTRSSEVIILPAIARRMYDDRLARISIFGKSSLFGEPAWDILLFIYIRMATMEMTTVTDACNGSGCPSTTALRWLKTLEDAHLIASRPDKMDNRKRYISLTANGIVKLESYLRLCAPHYAIL